MCTNTISQRFIYPPRAALTSRELSNDTAPILNRLGASVASSSTKDGQPHAVRLGQINHRHPPAKPGAARAAVHILLKKQGRSTPTDVITWEPSVVARGRDR